MTAAESVLSDAMVDVAVSAVAHGYGAAPIELRLLENGRAIDHRRVTPAAEGAPISETFRVAPNRDVPTVYTVEIPVGGDELVAENNARSALVPAAGASPPHPARAGGARLRAQLPAPGVGRAIAGSRSTRSCGRGATIRERRRSTCRPSRSRANALLGGYPNTREALFAYDVIVLANVDPDLLTNAQLAMTREFVGERGGGLLVLGARGFQRQGLRDTRARGRAAARRDRSGRPVASVQAAASPGRNRVAADAGRREPSGDAARRRSGGERQALGRGAGARGDLAARRREARRQRAGGHRRSRRRAARARRRAALRRRALDGLHRRSLVALADDAADLGSVLRAVLAAGGRAGSRRTRRSRSASRCRRRRRRATASRSRSPRAMRGYAPRARCRRSTCASRRRRVASKPSRADPACRRSRASSARRVRAAEPGVYRVAVDARRGQYAARDSRRATMLVGGVDPEMTDPRLNEDTLQRVARASGGAVLADGDTGGLLARLDAAAPAAVAARCARICGTRAGRSRCSPGCSPRSGCSAARSGLR